MAEPERDQELSRAYRTLAAEEPPRALDDAILAAARRRTARWRVPVAVAAVLVLAVGVTLRMLPQQPDAESVALAPQVLQAPRSAEPKAEAGATAERQAAEARARADAASARRANEAVTPSAAGAPRTAPASPAPAEAAVGARREATADSPALASAPAPAKLAKRAEAQTPEAWLERIAELKKQGRDREAEESLAEFRKRFPGYKIPEALTR